MLEVLPRVGPGRGGNLLRCALGNDIAAFVATLGAHIDDPVATLDDVEVVLNHQYGVAQVNQFMQHREQVVHILEVKAGGGFIENVEGVARGTTAEFLAEFDALRFAAREGGGCLSQADVAKAHGVERFELSVNFGDVLEELQRFLHGHVEDIGNGLAAEADFERFAVVAMPLALVTRHVDIGQELHFDADDAVALTGLAATALDVEGEAARLVAAGLGFGDGGEEVSDVGEESDVGGRVAARRAADGALIDVDDLVDVVDAGYGLVLAGTILGVVHQLGEAFVEHLDDERGFAAAADAGDCDELAQRDAHVHILEVVLGGALDDDFLAVAQATLGGHLNAAFVAHVLRREAIGAVDEVLLPGGADDVAAVLARARPHVDHEVGGADGVLVVFNHKHGIAQVAHPLEGVDEAGVVALVQANARLIEDIEDAHELAADLGG